MQKKLFIHIPKNAGMTIRGNKEFTKYCFYVKPNMIRGYKTFKTVMQSYNERDTKEVYHARWRDVIESYTSAFTAFAIVRNPWGKVVSRYLFAKNAIENEKVIGKDYADVRSLEHFLEERHRWVDKELTWYRAIRGWHPQLDHVVDEKGIVRCDILRFEHFSEDIKKYLQLSNMPKSRNITKIRKDYKKLYNNKTINIVADWYKKDIDYWGFDFDTGAQKNTWTI